MHIYVPNNGDRGQGEISDLKATVLMVNAQGDFLPSLYILKHSKYTKGI